MADFTIPGAPFHSKNTTTSLSIPNKFSQPFQRVLPFTGTSQPFFETIDFFSNNDILIEIKLIGEADIAIPIFDKDMIFVLKPSFDSDKIIFTTPILTSETEPLIGTIRIDRQQNQFVGEGMAGLIQMRERDTGNEYTYSAFFINFFPSVSVNTFDVQNPIISSISSNLLIQGEMGEISGDFFADNITKVSIGGEVLPASFVSGQKLLFQVPKLSSEGIKEIQVINTSEMTASIFAFYIHGLPAIDGLPLFMTVGDTFIGTGSNLIGARFFIKGSMIGINPLDNAASFTIPNDPSLIGEQALIVDRGFGIINEYNLTIL